jgi:hypothetical protein
MHLEYVWKHGRHVFENGGLAGYSEYLNGWDTYAKDICMPLCKSMSPYPL